MNAMKQRPYGLPACVRRLKENDVVRLGDYVVTNNGTQAARVTSASIWANFRIDNSCPWPFYRSLSKPKDDPLIAATKRIRSRTTLGQLEKLLAERSAAQRRVTCARDRLDAINRRIAKVAQTLAQSVFDRELEQVTTGSSK